MRGIRKRRGTFTQVSVIRPLIAPFRRAVAYLWNAQGRMMSRIPGMRRFSDMVFSAGGLPGVFRTGQHLDRMAWARAELAKQNHWRMSRYHAPALRRWKWRARRHAITERHHGYDMEDSDEVGTVLPGVMLFNW